MESILKKQSLTCVARSSLKQCQGSLTERQEDAHQCQCGSGKDTENSSVKSHGGGSRSRVKE